MNATSPKRVLVTGGSRGLGLAICRALAHADYLVLTVSRSGSAELDGLRRDFPGQVESIHTDLGNPGELQALTKHSQIRSGLDGFVANAAVAVEGLLALTSHEKIAQCIQVNLTSTILLTRAVIKGMLPRGGSIVLISSVTAIRGFAGLSVYSATKGALLSFSRSVAREYGARNIRCNAILPGFLETDMTHSLSPEDKERVQRRTALQRLGEPSDVTGMTKFLLSEEARFVTGSEFVVDGGLTT